MRRVTTRLYVVPGFTWKNKAEQLRFYLHIPPFWCIRHSVRHMLDMWGCSSVGRAPESHSGGHRFDPVQLHLTAVIIDRFFYIPLTLPMRLSDDRHAHALSRFMRPGALRGRAPAQGVAAYFTYRAVRTVRCDK